MVLACLALIPVAFVIALPAALLIERLSHRVGAMDTEAIAGQVKADTRRIPNTGGIAIFLGIALPLAAGLIAIVALPSDMLTSLVPSLADYTDELAAAAPRAGVLLGAVTILHLLGLIDDRRPLGAMPKLAIMLGVALGAAWLTDTRLLTLLDGRMGGIWASLLLTTAWIVVVTNAMNFMDNMDGLSSGVAIIAGSFFMAAALINNQWFVGAALALLVGATLGFWTRNFPFTSRGAKLFMGDGGSLVLGFLLAFLTVRTTYAPITDDLTLANGSGLGGGWYAVFMPLVVLAVPLYDFTSVTLIRLSQGKSPFVGDLQHFSHRLVRRGLTKRTGVLVIYAVTGVTAIGGVSLGSLQAWQAALVGVQTLLVVALIALLEFTTAKGADA